MKSGKPFKICLILSKKKRKKEFCSPSAYCLADLRVGLGTVSPVAQYGHSFLSSECREICSELKRLNKFKLLFHLEALRPHPLVI